MNIRDEGFEKGLDQWDALALFGGEAVQAHVILGHGVRKSGIEFRERGVGGENDFAKDLEERGRQSGDGWERGWWGQASNDLGMEAGRKMRMLGECGAVNSAAHGGGVLLEGAFESAVNGCYGMGFGSGCTHRSFAYFERKNIFAMAKAKMALAKASRWACSMVGLVDVRVYGHGHYFRARESDEPCILVFNHISFTDILLLVGHLDNVGFVGHGKHLSVFPVSLIAAHLNCVPVPSVDPRQSVTDLIMERVITRKRHEPLLAIAPDAAKVSKNPDEPIAPFRSGAFAGRVKVVPVVIRYFPDEHRPVWPEEEENIARVVAGRMRGEPLWVVMQVLPPMVAGEGESVEAFKERVRAAMRAAYLRLGLPRP